MILSHQKENIPNIFPKGWRETSSPTNHITDHDPEILTENHRETISWSAELTIQACDLIL